MSLAPRQSYGPKEPPRTTLNSSGLKIITLYLRVIILSWTHSARPVELGKCRPMARKNTGWKPMLHCFFGLSRDLSGPSHDFSPCIHSDDATA
jgi:hypothetical protein